MRGLMRLVGVIAGLGLLTGCGNEPVKKCTDETLHVINVLEAQYYEDARIPGSVNLPFDNFEKAAQAKLTAGEWHKTDRFVTYCANYQCLSSDEAAKNLKALGCKHVFVYQGGMAEWKSKGYPYEGKATEGYLSVVGEPTAHVDDGVEAIDAETLRQWLENAQCI